MGSPEGERGRWEAEGPQTRVTLTQGFWLGKYEVTQGEYLAVMGSNPSYFKPPDFPEDLDRPVEGVRWYDAANYCAELSGQEGMAGRLPTGYAYRLPTEAEWEYACRAGTTTRYSFGDALGCSDGGDWCALVDSYMWWSGNDENETHPVGQKLPNPWGLYDMHGHVWEWCGDWWSDELPGGIVVDPARFSSDNEGVRVLRGGAWMDWSICADCSWYYRSAGRCGGHEAHSGLGFRVVLAPGQQ